jgi:3-mercaptopyruvate sulfurtransferase SseA
VVYGSADGTDARRAAHRLRDLGYTDVRLLAGGLAGRRRTASCSSTSTCPASRSGNGWRPGATRPRCRPRRYRP